MVFDPFDEIEISDLNKEIFLMKNRNAQWILDKFLPLAAVKMICKTFPNFELVTLEYFPTVPWWQSRIAVSGYAVINDSRFYRADLMTYGRYIDVPSSVIGMSHYLIHKIPEPRYFNVQMYQFSGRRLDLDLKTLNDCLSQAVTESSKEYLEWTE